MTNRTLLQQIANDRDLFMDDTGGLAEAVTINGETGVGIYEAPAIITAQEFESIAPTLRVWGSDWSGLAQGQTVSVRDVTYVITRVERDSYGMTLLALRRYRG